MFVLGAGASSADTYAPIYATGRMNDDASFPHCKDTDVRVTHERIIKNNELRVDVTYGPKGQMSVTMAEDGKDVVRAATEYDHMGTGKIRLHSAKYGNHEMEVYVWPGAGDAPNMVWIGVTMFADGVKCSEMWHGQARRLDKVRP